MRWLQIGVLVNPIVYMSEGLRAALTPTLPHMRSALILSMLIVLPVRCLRGWESRDSFGALSASRSMRLRRLRCKRV